MIDLGNSMLVLSNGNPGALVAMKNLSARFGQSVIQKIEAIGIKGTDIYVLYSDICNKDEDMTLFMIDNVTNKNLLREACAKQDYSGREILKSYIDQYNKKNT